MKYSVLYVRTWSELQQDREVYKLFEIIIKYIVEPPLYIVHVKRYVLLEACIIIPVYIFTPQSIAICTVYTQ